MVAIISKEFSIVYDIHTGTSVTIQINFTHIYDLAEADTTNVPPVGGGGEGGGGGTGGTGGTGEGGTSGGEPGTFFNVEPNDLSFRYSGGSHNAFNGLSLGGVESTMVVISDAFDSVFGDIGGPLAFNGFTDYRCVYVRNSNIHGVPLKDAKVFIASNANSPTTKFYIGLGTAVQPANEQVIVNTTTAPVGVTFTLADSFDTGLSIGTLPANGRAAIWIKRVMSPGAKTGSPEEFFVLRLQGTSVPQEATA